MVERFGVVGRFLVDLAFRKVRMRPEGVTRIRRLAEQGTVIYVMRYRSTIDYLLVNALLLREGLPLARFAPGVSSVPWRPFGQMLRWLFRRPRPSQAQQHRECAESVAAGEPVLLFMRSQAVAGRRRWALSAARLGPQYLRDVLRASAGAARPVFLVPLAIFRNTGYRRKESRLATLVYSVQEAPGEVRRLMTYLWAPEELQVSVGREIALARFVEEHRRDGEERTVRRLTRALQIFLYREERVVLGPALLPRRVVREHVLRDPELARTIRQLAGERHVSRGRVVKEARRYLREMAAAFNGIYFGVLEFVFTRIIWPRTFAGLEIVGLERVVERMREHPVVLVPCHRSHFDYLILTYIFHTNYLSPPHIAAGINLSFWPMGPLFRGAGAFFIRRTFDDNVLYKTVFRRYLAFLIREGYTQEFFIEGGRTRTGKTLPPKLGVLSALVSTFLEGLRRDLYFVPVSIHYGRIPEEEAYRREVAGEEKQRESFGALLKARAILKRRYGTVYVSYGEPISLHDALGPLREHAQAPDADTEVVEEEQREFVERFGDRLMREINAVAVAGATSVSATALLAAQNPASRLGEFAATARTLLEVLRFQGVRFTASLLRNEPSGFRESLTWLESGGLVERRPQYDADDPVLHVTREARVSLDFYKNNTLHFFLLPALVARGLLAGVAPHGLQAYVLRWLEVFRLEFPRADQGALPGQLAGVVAFYRDHGALDGEKVRPDHPLIRVTSGLLENLREAYWMAARTVGSQSDWPLTRKALTQRMQRHFATALLLGDVRKPEGASVLAFQNALSWLESHGYVLSKRKRGGREPWFEPGPRFSELARLTSELRT
jgi:glycerol-3-phosphate O-acyltransferase